jgi:hypothetical protein
MIEARLRSVVLAAHVPFADESHAVTRALQVLRKEGQAGRHGIIVVNHAMPERSATKGQIA